MAAAEVAVLAVVTDAVVEAVWDLEVDEIYYVLDGQGASMDFDHYPVVWTSLSPSTSNAWA